MNLSRFRIALVGVIVVFIAVVSLITSRAPLSEGAAAATDWRDKVEGRVLSAASTGQAEFLIYMSTQADLSGANALETKDAKGQYVFQQLTSTAQATQPAVTQVLNSFGAQYQAFWVTNAIWAKGGLAVLQAVAERSDVAYVYASGGGLVEIAGRRGSVSHTGNSGGSRSES